MSYTSVTVDEKEISDKTYLKGVIYMGMSLMGYQESGSNDKPLVIEFIYGLEGEEPPVEAISDWFKQYYPGLLLNVERYNIDEI